MDPEQCVFAATSLPHSLIIIVKEFSSMTRHERVRRWFLNLPTRLNFGPATYPSRVAGAKHYREFVHDDHGTLTVFANHPWNNNVGFYLAHTRATTSNASIDELLGFLDSDSQIVQFDIFQRPEQKAYFRQQINDALRHVPQWDLSI